MKIPKYTYGADKCKECNKLKGATDLYFCSGCGYGKFEDENYAWNEVTLVVHHFSKEGKE